MDSTPTVLRAKDRAMVPVNPPVNEEQLMETARAELARLAMEVALDAEQHQQRWAEHLGVPVEQANSVGARGPRVSAIGKRPRV